MKEYYINLSWRFIAYHSPCSARTREAPPQERSSVYPFMEKLCSPASCFPKRYAPKCRRNGHGWQTIVMTKTTIKEQRMYVLNLCIVIIQITLILGIWMHSNVRTLLLLLIVVPIFSRLADVVSSMVALGIKNDWCRERKIPILIMMSEERFRQRK